MNAVCHDPKEALGTGGEGEVPITGREAQRGIEGFSALRTDGPRLYVLFMVFQLHTGRLQP